MAYHKVLAGQWPPRNAAVLSGNTAVQLGDTAECRAIRPFSRGIRPSCRGIRPFSRGIRPLSQGIYGHSVGGYTADSLPKRGSNRWLRSACKCITYTYTVVYGGFASLLGASNFFCCISHDLLFSYIIPWAAADKYTLPRRLQGYRWQFNWHVNICKAFFCLALCWFTTSRLVIHLP